MGRGIRKAAQVPTAFSAALLPIGKAALASQARIFHKRFTVQVYPTYVLCATHCTLGGGACVGIWMHARMVWTGNTRKCPPFPAVPTHFSLSSRSSSDQGRMSPNPTLLIRQAIQACRRPKEGLNPEGESGESNKRSWRRCPEKRGRRRRSRGAYYNTIARLVFLASQLEKLLLQGFPSKQQHRTILYDFEDTGSTS